MDSIRLWLQQEKDAGVLIYMDTVAMIEVNPTEYPPVVERNNTSDSFKAMTGITVDEYKRLVSDKVPYPFSGDVARNNTEVDV